ncbi:Transposase DDE domain protein [Maioricimonas rarisocia]|uniref:Transposase DDE domain protein n=1 Tax=Maioricimonas rarisocia TaxID=2528026 RepID=A0A517ZDF5_9PLAN|nr:IS4 family transposase [Maioricimonas rarisocia]QDU40507.1 Transposase DDE domain protein [Maioricimonas rarisocia]
MHCNQGRLSQQLNVLRRQFALSDELPFGNVLSTALVERLITEAGLTVHKRVFTPTITVLMFLWQVISQDHSCREVVARLLAFRAATGQPSCSPQTGGYCLARQRLPESFVAALARETGRELERSTPDEWRWKGRRVHVFDGSTVTMPDATANQEAYPQQPNQKQGLGFPIARIAAVFSLSCGAVLDLAICRYQGKGQSELGLLRSLWNLFAAGDVLLADRYICSWYELMELQQHGVDFVVRVHQSRKVDFRRGKRLGKQDHVVVWKKPRRRKGMDPAEYAALPDELFVREVRLVVSESGFRTRRLNVATSLQDPQAFSRLDLTDLYRQRWNAELDLRSLKQTMQMDMLRCKTPEMVRKELWTHILGYNLIRTVMAQAARQYALPPRQISFKGAMQAILAFQPYWDLCTPENGAALHAELLRFVASQRVGKRPNRIEPRAKKRRPNSYRLLTQPREIARAAILNGSCSS